MNQRPLGPSKGQLKKAAAQAWKLARENRGLLYAAGSAAIEFVVLKKFPLRKSTRWLLRGAQFFMARRAAPMDEIIKQAGAWGQNHFGSPQGENWQNQWQNYAQNPGQPRWEATGAQNPGVAGGGNSDSYGQHYPDDRDQNTSAGRAGNWAHPV